MAKKDPEPETNRADDDARWLALLSRDKNVDALFFYSVKSTGVYCRISCGARTPLRKNVAFHATTADAERAGFRPCKRCKPEERSLTARQSTLIANLCRFIERSIERADKEPTLAQLAERAGMSSYHLHRIFRSATGVTPKAYAAAQRSKRVRASLKRSATVTEAIYDAGYSSNGRFYDNSNRVLGMTPTNYRRGAAELDIRVTVSRCTLGPILVAATERGICAILVGDDPVALQQDLERRFPRAKLLSSDVAFAKTVAKVVQAVDRPTQRIDLPLDIRGTAFQQRDWQELQKIPLGKTASYKEIAEKLGAPQSSRAVAQACGANALAVLIPCHRVVRGTGEISGYRWGVERKRKLLESEAQAEASSRATKARASKTR